MELSKEALEFFKKLSKEAVVLPNLDFDIYSDEKDEAEELEEAGMIWLEDKHIAVFTRAGVDYIEKNFTNDFA